MSALDAARDLLGRKIRVRISDHRVIEGELQCIDREMNIVLNTATEFHDIAEGK